MKVERNEMMIKWISMRSNFESKKIEKLGGKRREEK